MINFGPVPAGSVLPVFFSTYGKTNGESITLTGLAVTDIEIYKGTSVTQRASDAGYALIDTDGIDVDGVTGIHAFSIDTGDNTDAGFYAAGSFYTVIVSAVTIDAQTVNFIAATFSIRVAESVAGIPVVDTQKWLGGTIPAVNVTGIPKVDATHLLGTAWLTPGTAGTPDVNAKLWNGLTTVALPLVPTTAGRTLDVSATGEAGVDWANVGSQSTAVNLSATTVNLTNTVTTYTGNTPQTGDTYALANGANGFVAIKADTAATLDDTGTAGVVVAAGSKTGYALSATGSAALTEGYAALGAAPTIAQLLYEIRALLAEKAVSGTTLTAKKLDGSTTAATYTLNDATTPTAITRAS